MKQPPDYFALAIKGVFVITLASILGACVLAFVLPGESSASQTQVLNLLSTTAQTGIAALIGLLVARKASTK